jgi:phosphoglycolate phosphatase-like HAD superfamily hydrolase
MSTHLVWDWNGTLFHDIDAVIGATNASFAELGLPSITVDRYRELYCVPVPRFYERLLGRLPSDAEWAVMDATFHRYYWALAESCGLAEGAAELLAARRAAGLTQSLCSLAPHEQLVPIVAAHGISDHFLRVDGRRDSSTAGKAAQMVRHLESLGPLDPRDVVVIGDTLDDAVAAAHVGARAVLYTGGSHTRAALESAGVPVVDSLAEAVAQAERIAS